MASLGEILSYQGNAGLGLGSNADVPVTYSKPVDSVNQAIRDVALRDAQKNMMIYQQRIKDRDAMLGMISNGDIRTGDHLDRDTPVVKKAMDEMDTAFYDWMKKGPNDLDAASAYQKAKRNAQDVATQAQARKLFYDKESQAAAQERLPKFAEARKANIEKNLSGFWNDWTPYQQASTLDIKPIESFARPITEQLPEDKNKPYQKGTRTYLSYNDTLKDAQSYGLTPEGSFNLKNFHDALKEMPPLELADKIRSTNLALKQYNEERGLQPGMEDYASPIQLVPVRDQQGGLQDVQINEPLDKLAAKFSLAQHPKFQTDTYDIDKGQLDLFKAQSGRITAQAAAARARAYSALQNKKISRMTDDEKRVKGFWDGVVDRISEYEGSPGNKVDFLWLGNLPEGYTYMAGVDAKGQPIKLKPFTFTDSKTGKEAQYYQPKYRNASSGEDVNKKFLTDKYKEYKGNGGKGNYDTYLRTLIKNGVIDLEVQGQNGTADFNSALQSARALSNKLTSGKEEPVFGETDQTETDNQLQE